jgi:hypothetical protein
MILANHGIISSSGASVDTDALAFITATGITDTTQKSAITTLVSDLKSYNIWSKMKAIYPFVGGTASTHKFNLKDPRDLDAAFRLTFSGGGTHSSTGYLTNNSNAYANTFFSPSANQSLTSGSFGLYSRSSGFGMQFASNGIRNALGQGVQMIIRRGDNLCVSVMWDEGTGGVASSGTSTDARGFYLINRTANNSLKLFKNNSIIAANTNNQSASGLQAQNYFIGGLNDGGNAMPFSYENKEFAFGLLGDGLSDSEESNLYTSIQSFQNTLGRAI